MNFRKNSKRPLTSPHQPTPSFSENYIATFWGSCPKKPYKGPKSATYIFEWKMTPVHPFWYSYPSHTLNYHFHHHTHHHSLHCLGLTVSLCCWDLTLVFQFINSLQDSVADCFRFGCFRDLALVEDQDSGHWQWLMVIKRAIKVWSAEWPFTQVFTHHFFSATWASHGLPKYIPHFATY